MDAIYAIVLTKEAREKVELLWSTWKGSNNTSVVCPLMLNADSDDIPQGARAENSIQW